jgi:hypothetical protein
MPFSPRREFFTGLLENGAWILTFDKHFLAVEGLLICDDLDSSPKRPSRSQMLSFQAPAAAQRSQ